MTDVAERPVGIAKANNGRFFSRRKSTKAVRPPPRAITAAASPINLRDRTEARRLRSLRQGWQEDAWAYSDNVPEVGFAYRFLANCSKRMRIMPMCVNPEDPDGTPITLEDAGVPAEVIQSCTDAMALLGTGRIGKSPLMESMSWSLGVVGEGWMLGRTDEETGVEEWSVRSIDEVMIEDDGYKLRETPVDPQGTLGWIPLDLDSTYLSRMWVPHPRFRALATSPMRQLLDTCENLLLLGRDVRSIARSRIAGAGFLKVPEGLSILSFTEDNTDPSADRFLGTLTDLMMTPIAEEGVASAVVPAIIRGEAEALAQFQHMLMDRPYSALAIELRSEEIGRLANGLDLPRAVVLGMEDVNHWGQWQISDDTFRHHVEPGVITQVDALTMAFLRPLLVGDNIDPFWVDRIVMWYDPTELVTHPDQTSDAITLYNLKEISGKALRRVAGFTEEDAPAPIEVVTRAVSATRTYPPNALLAILARLDPTLTFPAITTSGTFPGIHAGSVEAPPPPPVPGAAPPAASAPGLDQAAEGAPTPPPAIPAPPAASQDTAPAHTPPSPQDVGASERAANAFGLAAAKTASNTRLSRKLTEVDSLLRSKVHVAACAALVRVLEKAGAKLRTTANGRKFKASVVPAIANVSNLHVASTLGPALVAAMGFPDSHALLSTDWSDLKSQFYAWTESAQAQAVAIAAQLAGMSSTDSAVVDTKTKLASHIDDAWKALVEALDTQAEAMLYDPTPSAPHPKDVSYNPANVVPMGVVRRVIGIAGGSGKKSALTAAGEYYDPSSFLQPGMDMTTSAQVDVTTPTGGASDDIANAAISIGQGQIGTGADMSDMLTGAGMEVASFTWEHNYGGEHPLDGHLRLDGTSFANFTDDVLANSEDDWIGNDFYMPGDHDGCMCDFTTEWQDGTDSSTIPGADDTESDDDEDHPVGATEGMDLDEDDDSAAAADDVPEPVDTSTSIDLGSVIDLLGQAADALAPSAAVDTVADLIDDADMSEGFMAGGDPTSADAKLAQDQYQRTHGVLPTPKDLAALLAKVRIRGSE